jgi:hypothetical protein
MEEESDIPHGGPMATERITVTPMNGEPINFDFLIGTQVVGLGVLHRDHSDSDSESADSLVDPDTAPQITTVLQSTSATTDLF